MQIFKKKHENKKVDFFSLQNVALIPNCEKNQQLRVAIVSRFREIGSRSLPTGKNQRAHQFRIFVSIAEANINTTMNCSPA